jgi:aldehyde dehydrogenase (NAD+)
MSEHSPTSVFEAQRAHRRAQRISSFEDRREKLTKLRDAIRSHEAELKSALHEDFRKSPAETDLTEILTTLTEVNHTLQHLREWMKPTAVPTPITLMGSRSEIRMEPKGVVLIIAPWNYPFSLAINPLIAALAAGNSVVLKPSELTPRTSALIRKMLSRLYPSEEVAVCEGGPKTSQELLALPFDHIFFTGSTRVGRIVAEAAAKNLVPVTLELGGKSPAVIDESADLALAARRTIWGKFLNGGQTCVAPDYVLVPKSHAAAFLKQAKKALAGLYGAESEREKNPDLCRIITPSHAERLAKLVREAVAQGAKIEAGGGSNVAQKYMAPTLLTNVPLNCALMQEEIFGPVLPILAYSTWKDAEHVLRTLDRPLAMYVFSEDADRAEALLSQFSSGGACINGTVLHLGNPDLPFGGTGPSGMGNYHGIHGFRAFSHERSVLRQKHLSSLDWFHPPYTKAVGKRLKLIFKLFT